MKKNNNNICPKCGAKFSPFYMKEDCPSCGVNLLYYKLDERLAEDAANAEKEVAVVNRLLDVLKSSTISDVWHIIRIVLFFLPLGSMCLPMYYAGHKKVSLISVIMGIINHGFDIGAWATDYLVSVLAIVLVIVLSLVVIIASLFSSTKNGYKRDMVLSAVNTLVFGGLSVYACTCGGRALVGFYVTMLVYLLVFVMHFVVAPKPKQFRQKRDLIIAVALCVLITVNALAPSVRDNEKKDYDFMINFQSDVDVVSFNVASAFGTSIEDTDSITRAGRFADYMHAVDPDIIGTQEINSYWIDELGDKLPEYSSYAVKRGGDSDENNSEMNAVFWRTDQFKVLEKNTFWLSETPEKESKYTYTDENGEAAEAGCNRICTYVVLEDEKGPLLFMNTHLDNSSEQARKYGASVILQHMHSLQARYFAVRIVLTGDFNEYITDDACAMITAELNDSTYDPVKKATYQEWGYTDTGNDPIDFIFTNGNCNEYRVLDDLSNGYVSDHYGIFASVTY